MKIINFVFVIKNKTKQMEEETYEERTKKLERENNIAVARGIACSLKLIFNRQRTIDDPCLRNCLFVDKLSMSLDIMIGFLNSVIIEYDMPDDLKLDIANLSKIISTELTQLMDWVRSPMYSPDSGFGKNYTINNSQTHGMKE